MSARERKKTTKKKTATASKSDYRLAVEAQARELRAVTFGRLIETMRALYEEEVDRLSDVYAPRILAGEFSGEEDTDGIGPAGWQISRGDPRYLRLERELKDGQPHPFLATERSRLVVVACSGWFEAERNSVTNPKTGEQLVDAFDTSEECAAECLAHDVLAVAAARRWVKPMRYLGDRACYALRVA